MQEVGGAEERERHARNELSALRAKVSAAEDQALRSSREAERQERSLRAEMQVDATWVTHKRHEITLNVFSCRVCGTEHLYESSLLTVKSYVRTPYLLVIRRNLRGKVLRSLAQTGC